MEAQTQSTDPINHSQHMYSSRDETQYDALRETLEDSLDIPGAPLPPAFTGLRIPEMAGVVNQLHLSEAAEVIRRLPLEVAITLCDAKPFRYAPVLEREVLAGAASGSWADTTTLTAQAIDDFHAEPA